MADGALGRGICRATIDSKLVLVIMNISPRRLVLGAACGLGAVLCLGSIIGWHIWSAPATPENGRELAKLLLPDGDGTQAKELIADSDPRVSFIEIEGEKIRVTEVDGKRYYAGPPGVFVICDLQNNVIGIQRNPDEKAKFDAAYREHKNKMSRLRLDEVPQ